MKLNRGALKLCAAYTGFLILMLGLAHLASDPTGRLLLSSVGWFPVGITFAVLHLFPLMYANPWMNTPFFLFPISFLIVYLVGWSISSIKDGIARRRLRAAASASKASDEASARDLRPLEK
jgi:hypothetical protein